MWVCRKYKVSKSAQNHDNNPNFALSVAFMIEKIRGTRIKLLSWQFLTDFEKLRVTSNISCNHYIIVFIITPAEDNLDAKFAGLLHFNCHAFAVCNVNIFGQLDGQSNIKEEKKSAQS